MTIPELYQQKLAYWTKANQEFLGLTPIDESLDYKDIQKSLDADCKKYWNGPQKYKCKLVQNLNSGKLNQEIAKQTPDSYKFKWNFKSRCVDFYADYGDKTLLIGAMPTPCNDLTWIINGSHYVPRITATRNFFHVVSKKDFETVIGEGWSYSITNDKFTCDIIDKRTGKPKFNPTIHEIFTNYLSKRSIAYLTAVLKEPVTEENFVKGLKLLNIFAPNSIFNYKFAQLEYFEEAVLNSKKYARPTKRILLGVNTTIGAKIKKFSYDGEDYEGCLVRSESKIFALENFSTCVNIYNMEEDNKKTSFGYSRKVNKQKNKKVKFQPAFTYTDANGFFDSFKTVTSKSAGRQRLLLDNVFCRDGMFWIIEDDGTEHNMYEYLGNPQKKRLSCLSEAPFCNNDKPKRIMMNAKMTSQAVTLKEESDDLTHRIKARVGFTDLEGYTSADSIVISESFAKRLRTYDNDILYLSTSSKLFETLKLINEKDNKLDLETLKLIYPNKNYAILLGYENSKIDRIDYVEEKTFAVTKDINKELKEKDKNKDKNKEKEDKGPKSARVFISWEIPFRLGDKITNLHGAKGTVGLILPDDKMPKLTKKVGEMEPGPLEVIISGFSTIRRGSLGQIFEAWALASGIDYVGHDYIAEMIEKYKTQMKKFSKDSIVVYNGEKKVIPLGLNFIMRLFHHASTKISCSSADHGYTRTLRFGEMEKFNLVANGCPNILRELGIRSIVKYVGSHKLVTEIEATRTLPKKAKITMRFIEILKSMGYNLSWDNNSTKKSGEIKYVDSNTDYSDTDNSDEEYYYYETNDDFDDEDEYDEIDITNKNSLFMHNKENLGYEDDDSTD